MNYKEATMKEILQRAKKVKLVVFDVDGVLTDGSLFYGDNGEEYKAFYAKDGLGMKLLMRTGVQIGIITARNSSLVKHRMDSLGIDHLYQGRLDKLNAFDDLLNKLNLHYEQTAFVGDDVVDLPVMNKVGLSITVKDAHPLVVAQAHWQTPLNGGRGAARNVCELIMQAQNTLEEQLHSFSK